MSQPEPAPCLMLKSEKPQECNSFCYFSSLLPRSLMACPRKQQPACLLLPLSLTHLFLCYPCPRLRYTDFSLGMTVCFASVHFCTSRYFMQPHAHTPILVFLFLRNAVNKKFRKELWIFKRKLMLSTQQCVLTTRFLTLPTTSNQYLLTFRVFRISIKQL